MSDQHALSMTELVADHYEVVYRFAYRLCGSVADSEDLVQHTFMTAQTKLSQLQDPTRVRGWLLTITRNRFRQNLRRVSPSQLDNEGLIAEPDSDVLEGIDVDPQELQRALDRLSADAREILVLFYFDELSYKLISEELDVPMGTVMSRLSRAKANLRKILDEASRSPASSNHN